MQVTLQPLRARGRRGDPLRGHPAAARADGRVVRVREGRGAGHPRAHRARASRSIACASSTPRSRSPTCSSAIRMLKKELKVPLIGFAGAPFTLASYLVEGGKSANFAKTKKLMFGAPDAWHALMEKLSRGRAALPARADRRRGRRRAALRLVGRATSRRPTTSSTCSRTCAACSPTSRAPGVPVIHFGTGTATLLEAMRDAGGTVIGVDFCTPLDDGVGARRLRPRRAGQHGPVRSPGDARRSPPRTRSGSSTRRPGGPGTSSTSGTASCPRRPSTTCAPWSTTSAKRAPGERRRRSSSSRTAPSTTSTTSPPS